jgi:DNA-binding SARP family transcriptional activator
MSGSKVWSWPIRPGVDAVAVEFRLLGDVQARVDGRVVELGHARQRCVLVALLVDANRAVPVDQLVDRVWSDRVPQRGREALYSYVSRLRRALAGAGDVRITHQPGGYVITVDPMVVDLHRFQDLVGRARATGDDAAAAALLTQALALWRGDAFATLDTPWLSTVRDALDRQRLAAELDRNDLALRHGEHTSLLTDLFARAAAYPLDERLAGQLMLALYRSGRQADAMDCYQRLRLRLASELGADPCPPLQHLHQQILAADAALEAPTPLAPRPRTGSAHAVVPRQLPAPSRTFTGRVGELARLDEILATADEQPATVVISALSGTAGVGKTALAVHWAHRVAHHFPDGQLYVNLRGFDPTGLIVSPSEALRGFLEALGLPPQDVPTDLEPQAALYRSVLAGRRVLVLLDNARDVEQARPLLPATPGCLVLVTSRNQLSGLVATEGAHPLNLDLMSAAESHDLMARHLGRDRVAAEQQAVEQIIRRCARLPLALAVLGARAAAHPQFSLAALADELGGALDVFGTGDEVSDVRAVFSWSYRALTAEAARLFGLLGLHPGPDIAAPAAASLAGTPVHQVRPLLAELARAHLLSEPVPNRFTFHDLMRAYAGEQASTHIPTDERRTALHRVFDHYLHTAHAAHRLLKPHRYHLSLTPPQPGVAPEPLRDAEQAQAWFTTEHRVLVAAIRHASATGFATHTWQLARTLTDFLERHARWHELRAVHLTGLAAARRLPDRAGQAHAHRDLAIAYSRLGDRPAAERHLEHALALFRDLGDRALEAYCHMNLGAVLLGGVDRAPAPHQDRGQEALDHTRRALDVFVAIDHRIGQATALGNLGWTLVLLGDHEAAVTCNRKAVDLHRQTGNRLGESSAWHNLGNAHHHLGRYEDAVACYQRALELRRGAGDLYEAGALHDLGNTHHLNGDVDAARHAWRQALAILDRLHHPDADHVRAKLPFSRP